MSKVVYGLSAGVLALAACASFAAWAADPAAAAVPPREKGPFPVLTLPERAYGGQRAIDALGDRLADVAQWYGMSSEELKAKLLRDGTLRVDQQGRLFYVESAPRRRQPDAAATPSGTGSSAAR